MSHYTKRSSSRYLTVLLLQLFLLLSIIIMFYRQLKTYVRSYRFLKIVHYEY